MAKGMKSAPTRAATSTGSKTVTRQATKTVSKAPAKSTMTNAVTRGQLQGAATSGPKKLEPSNFLFSKSLVNKAKSWTHKTFGTTRRKIHKALAEDPAFLKSKHATKENLKRMKAGKAPLAPKNEQLGKRKTMELDHIWERRDGVKENRVDNLRLVSPLKHKMKMMRKFHQAAETEMPRNLKAAPAKAAKRGVKTL